ncbi:MAG: TlpA family protein disulfide reductase [Candidatus Symbiothrix sp.]|jgi:thiol-disulfide isomerase/thioredoxin|nr:TlpA family protein disulfide reductase [Candidatus Symbiothrix sp.]
MKKGFYFLNLLFLVFACCKTETPVDYYQIALNSEARLDSINQLYDSLNTQGLITPELDKQLEAQWDSLYEQTIADYAQFFTHHINDSIGQAVFASTSWGTRRLSIEQLDTILAQADSAFQATELYQASVERLNRMKLTAPGTPFQEIVSKTPAGKEIKLSDFAGKGKYVLLDFWASWCPPCRAEMPHLLELYAQYKDKRFEIVGYSLDRNDADWKKGLAELKMTWPQMSDCAFWQSLPVQLYDVHGIPATVLIGPDGKIIEKGLRGEALTQRLQELIR